MIIFTFTTNNLTTFWHSGIGKYYVKNHVLSKYSTTTTWSKTLKVSIAYIVHKNWHKRVKGHSVEISGFFYHSDLTWNQFWWFYKWKICQFNTFAGSEFIFFNFCTFWSLKTAVWERLDSPKMISRKIWVIEKSWNFHTVHTVLVITTKSPVNKDFEISEILLKIVFYFT